MKHLYLLRHAHAASQDLGFADFDRPLDKKGQEGGAAVAYYLSQKKITFDIVLCSAALRAQETLEPLRPIIGTNNIEISEKFYNIPEDKILDSLRQLSKDITTVLYIGHNPGITFFILKFAKTLPQFLMEGITPATLAGFQFPLQQWEDLTWGSGEITDIFQPALDVIKSPAQQEP